MYKVAYFTHLKFGYDLVDEWDEILQLLGVGVLKEMLHDDRDERQDFRLQANYHAVQELAHPSVQQGSVYRGVEGAQEDLEGIGVGLHAATVLHGLLVSEALAGTTVEDVKSHQIHYVSQQGIWASFGHPNPRK